MSGAAKNIPNPFFRSKKLDLGCYVNIKVIRDHTKRKAFAEFETQRYVFLLFVQCAAQ